jgi:serine/threonine protein kinase
MSAALVTEECARAKPPEQVHGGDGTVELFAQRVVKRLRRQDYYANEVLMLTQLAEHPNILHPLSTSLGEMTITFPRLQGDLMAALITGSCAVCTKGCVSGLLAALEHCHRAYLVHRDIKPENVLLDGAGDPVLTDFARSRFAPEPIALAFGGTRCYAAPEALRNCCCLANDIWSLGVVFFSLVERLLPYDDDDDLEAQPMLEFMQPEWHSCPFGVALRAAVFSSLRLDVQARPRIGAIAQRIRSCELHKRMRREMLVLSPSCRPL